MKILILFAFIVTVAGLNCNYFYDCYNAEITTSNNYVVCDTGVCRCVTERGFVGSATTNDKCRCPDSTTQVKYEVGWNNNLAYCKKCESPSQFYWLQPDGYSQNFPFCANPVVAEEQERRYIVWEERVRRLIEYYSKQQVALGIITGQIPTSEIAPVSGIRAYPIGNSGSISEYFYGLSAVNNINGTLRSSYIDTKKGAVCIESDFEFDQLQTGIHYKLSYLGCFRIDENDQIYSADLYIPNFGRTLNPPPNFVSVIKSTLDNAICQVHQQYCNGTNQQYANTEACLDFMESVPLGDYDRFQGNNTICRNLHSWLAIFVPEHHCPHIGPNGGNPGDLQCVDIHWTSYYDVDF